MAMYDTHVFLGPSLDLKTARQYLWDAHYHPPIQCGDLLRLLRIMPKRIILIDGLYEQVPAVWHKEILLALDCGISLYGAASMGALRAAELHPYGMIGVGKVFEAFLSKQLTDDDEVAVLHQCVEQDWLVLNDAMVNIRETLAQAYQAAIISRATQQLLINGCKAQFYPNRSLKRAVEQVEIEVPERRKLQVWLEENGVVDVKRQDAIEVLRCVQETSSNGWAAPNTVNMPYTKFIATLVDEVISTPFSHTYSWLPESEKKLALLSLNQEQDYKLINELAGLIKSAYAVINEEDLLDSHQTYLFYIQEQGLYFPQKLGEFFSQHPTLSLLYPWLLHHVCLVNLTPQRVEKYLPAVAFYFDCELDQDSTSRREILSLILLLVLLLHQQLDDPRLTIKRVLFEEHLQEIKFWVRYKKASKRLPSVKIMLDFVMMYMKVIYIHQGVKDFKLGLATPQTYFHWIYDAMRIYEQVNSE